MPDADWFAALIERIRDFQENRVLIAALELDLFSAVGMSGATAAEAAAGAGTDARATAMLLDALVSVGAMRKSADGVYRNRRDGARFLVAGSPEDRRGALMHTVNVWRNWTTLADAVRTGGPVSRPGVEGGDRDWTESFIAAMHQRAVGEAPALVEAAGGATGVRRLLDIGGGSGAFSIAFAQANAALQADVFDLAPVLPIAQRHIRAAGLESRVRTRAGDLTCDEFGTGYQLALLSAICHMLGVEENRNLLARVARAVDRGGRVVIRDFIVEAGRTAPKRAALFALNMLVGTRRGSTYTEAEYREWLEAAGFTDVRRPDPAGDLIVATRA